MMTPKEYLEDYDPQIKEMGYDNYVYSPKQVISLLRDYALEVMTHSIKLVRATESVDFIVKGRVYRVIEEEPAGFYIIDETGKKEYYHKNSLNIC